MAFLEVHANPNPQSRGQVPLLLDIQADMLSALLTRAVVPMYRREAVAGQVMTRLTPMVEFEGAEYVLMVPELAGISRRQLGPSLGILPKGRPEVIAALDLLVTGV